MRERFCSKCGQLFEACSRDDGMCKKCTLEELKMWKEKSNADTVH